MILSTSKFKIILSPQNSISFINKLLWTIVQNVSGFVRWFVLFMLNYVLDTAPKEILDEFNQLAEEEDHDPFAYVFILGFIGVFHC